MDHGSRGAPGICGGDRARLGGEVLGQHSVFNETLREWQVTSYAGPDDPTMWLNVIVFEFIVHAFSHSSVAKNEYKSGSVYALPFVCVTVHASTTNTWTHKQTTPVVTE